MRNKNIVFLGTSHIARQSLIEVKESIKEQKPDIIALELDEKRMHALMGVKKKRRMDFGSIRRIGIKGFLFALFAEWAEKKLGKIVGVSPGSEMKQAIRIARKESIPVALIDQDIEITLKRLSSAITFRERLNFFGDAIKSIFARKSEIEFDLSKVPDKEIIRKLTQNLRQRYPNVYNVLIHERNIAIAKNLKSLSDANSNKKILAILGAGHVHDVSEML